MLTINKEVECVCSLEYGQVCVSHSNMVSRCHSRRCRYRVGRVIFATKAVETSSVGLSSIIKYREFSKTVFKINFRAPAVHFSNFILTLGQRTKKFLSGQTPVNVRLCNFDYQ